MKIYSTYKPVIIPLGGANNFINALFESIEKRYLNLVKILISSLLINYQEDMVVVFYLFFS